MATYMFREKWKGWEKVDDGVDLESYGRLLCEEEAYCDNDGGYCYYVEFWRDGVTTFAYAEYDSYHGDYEGAMNSFMYGSYNEVLNSGGFWSKYIKSEKYKPNRDWIII